MAFVARAAAVVPLVAAVATAAALTGAAVLTVAQAGCSDSGHYVVQHDGQVRLVGGCLNPAELPPAPKQQTPQVQAPGATNGYQSQQRP